MSARDGRAPGPQLSLGLPAPAAIYPADSFLVTAANREAFDLAQAFAGSGEGLLIVCGPRGAGKTHLLHAVFGAGVIATTESDRHMNNLAAIDDCDRACEPMTLLRVIEDRRRRGLRTALAGRDRPRAWARGLKDLETRLEAAPRAELADPGEDLLAAVLAQHFRTRQLRTARGVVAYAAPRIPKTFAAAAAFAEAAAHAAAEGRPITVDLAKTIVANLFEGPFQP